MTAMLPAPKPRRLKHLLKVKPRKMYPVHMHGINQRKDGDHYGEPWSIDLLAVPMESLRSIWPIRYRETKEAEKNLAFWLKCLGGALYNPIWWKQVVDPQFTPRKRLNPWMRKVHGSHRVRALEALDFDFVWVYWQIGAVDRLPRDDYWQMQRNEVKPAVSRFHCVCEKCGKTVNHGRGTKRDSEGKVKRHYTCQWCGHFGYDFVIYPEPV